jgi:hypothetical protein
VDGPEYFTSPDTCPIEGQEPDAPLVLKQVTSRLMAAIGLSLFALFWNGFIGLFVYLAFTRQTPWFATLIIGVLALVGILVFVNAVAKIMQLWNPVSTLVCSQRYLYPGSQFEISWLHQGRTSRIQAFKITLVGEEQATFRQGTSSRTETNCFHEQIIIDTTDQARIQEGFELVQLDHDVMHTFKATRNRIRWALKVTGKIAFWPDIADEYEITLYAPPAR